MTLKFTRKEVKPGAKAKLRVKAAAHSRVFLLGVDKSVRLLGTGNDITREQVSVLTVPVVLLLLLWVFVVFPVCQATVPVNRRFILCLYTGPSQRRLGSAQVLCVPKSGNEKHALRISVGSASSSEYY